MGTPLRFVAGMGVLVLSISAIAQSPAAPVSNEDVKTLDPISVTGYHIKRIDLEGPAPVIVFEREDLEQAGVNTLQEFARYLPINLPEAVRQDGAIGATGFDLRGIGFDTTLVLVDGHRIAPYAQLAENAVDINSIPVSAIERIEVLKDGASAIYGADAIAGVVNIVLRKGFDGIQASGAYGKSQRADGRELLADLVGGRASERGSIMFSLSWYDLQPQAMRDRDWSDDGDYSDIGGPNRRSSIGSPPSVYRYDNGLSEPDPACGADPAVSSVGPSYWGARLGSACKYNWPWHTELLWGLERLGATISGRYEIKPGLSFLGDLLYSHSEGEVERAPSPMFYSPLMETMRGFPFVPASHPFNPFDADGELLTRPLAVGNRTHINDSSAYRLLAGLEGLAAGWDWRLSLLASRNRVKKEFLNMVPLSAFQLALLGQGGPQGDLWYNPFGYRPENDPAVIDWLRTTAHLRDSSSERSADLLISRSFGSLSGGPVGLAMGLQYREQELEQWADDLLMSGDLGAVHEPVSAERSIFSAYAEASLPLLDRLELQLALRYEHYSDFGSTTNPKIALRWQPLSELMLRASWSTSYKPPSFYELYIPPFDDWDWYKDRERCALTGSEQDCDWRQYPVRERGNPDLEPEKGESWFAGMVWEPGFLPGFEFQLDFWKFRHHERIEWVDGQTVLDEDGDFGIVREPTGPDGIPGPIILVQETFVNTDELLTRGFDTTLRYHWQTSNAGRFHAGLMHSYIDKWIITDSLDLYNKGRNFAGAYRWDNALPRNRANLNISWDKGANGLAANLHYTGHYENWSMLWIDGEESDEVMTIPSHTTLDLQYRHQFGRLRNATLRIGCNNVTDTSPPLTYWPVNEPFHDARGRYFYIRWQQPIL